MWRGDHGVFARQQVTRRLLRGAVGGQSGVRVRRDVLRRERLRQLDERALAGEEIFRVTAVGVDARKAAALGVHVLAAPARQAMAARNQRMANHCVADLDGRHPLADRFDPAGVFVAHDVREIDFDLVAPNAFDDVEIRAAYPGAADTDNDIRRARDLRVRRIFVFHEVLSRQRLVISMQNGRFHIPPLLRSALFCAHQHPPERGSRRFRCDLTNTQGTCQALGP